MLHSEENVLKHKQLNEEIGGTDWQEKFLRPGLRMVDINLPEKPSYICNGI
jgi:hypothetical protein